MLLVGPPGTGKTLLARAVAGEAKVPFFSLSGSEFVEMFVGVGAARVRDLFAQAEAKAPCIVFIDELDALGKVRVQSPIGSHEEREQTLNQLLAEMDGFDARKADHHHGRDQPARGARPGAAAARAASIARCWSTSPTSRGAKRSCGSTSATSSSSPEVDLRKVAARTAGFAGADLANLVNEAALLAARRDKPSRRHARLRRGDRSADRRPREEARDEHEGARDRRVPRIGPRHRRQRRCPGTDPVHKISIVARGFGALGYTMQLPLEDRYLMQRRDLMNQLAMLLGGRSAEEIALGEISTGAQNDLQRVTDIARSMVTEWGMSERLGAVNFDAARAAASSTLGRPPSAGRTARKPRRMIDDEVKMIVTEAHNDARRILTRQARRARDASPAACSKRK